MKQFEAIRDYYGRVLKDKNDLKTTACCSPDAIASHLKPLVAKVHPEVQSRFYGCGVPIPEAIEGCHVVDLGSGTGRDCFVLSALVGESGSVIGVDMTDEQLDCAEKYKAYHLDTFGLTKDNLQFKKGYIEDLQAAGIADNSTDLVVSNCVTNLSPDKERVFSEIYRVLKPGGELYFSDVFTDRRLPPAFAEDPVLLGECLGGAMYTEDFRRLMTKIGFPDLRVMTSSEIFVTNPEVAKKTGNARFFSYTFRIFKLNIEDRCEDYGQVARYKGSIPEFPHAFRLDDHHLFQTGKPMTVCSNTAAMLAETRFGPHFEVEGDLSTHYGLFDCAPQVSDAPASGSGACC